MVKIHISTIQKRKEENGPTYDQDKATQRKQQKRN